MTLLFYAAIAAVLLATGFAGGYRWQEERVIAAASQVEVANRAIEEAGRANQRLANSAERCSASVDRFADEQKALAGRVVAALARTEAASQAAARRADEMVKRPLPKDPGDDCRALLQDMQGWFAGRKTP